MFLITLPCLYFSDWITECFCGADELVWLIIFNEQKVPRDHQFLNSSIAAPLKQCKLWLCQEIWQGGLRCSLGHYWKQETEKEKEWKRGRTKRKETEGGCSRLVHAVQHLMKAYCNRLSVLYHRESHRSRFLLLTLIPDPFAHERRTDPPGLFASSPGYTSILSVCGCVSMCVPVYPSTPRTAYPTVCRVTGCV